MITNLDFINMSGPRAFYLAISRPCNMTCKFCYEKFKLKEYTTDEEVDDILYKIQKSNLRKEDIIHLDRTEMIQSIEFDLLIKILEFIKKCNKDTLIKIYTNGTELNLEKYKKLKEYNIFYVIAIDTENFETRIMKNGEKSLEQVKKNLKEIINYDNNALNILSIRYVITNENFKDVIPSMLKINEETSINIFSFNPDGTVEFDTDKELRHLNLTKKHKEIYNKEIIVEISKEIEKIIQIMKQNNFKIDRATLNSFLVRYGKLEVFRELNFMPVKYINSLVQLKWSIVQQLDKRNFIDYKPNIMIDIDNDSGYEKYIETVSDFDKNIFKIFITKNDLLKRLLKNITLTIKSEEDILKIKLEFKELSIGRGNKNYKIIIYKIKETNFL